MGARDAHKILQDRLLALTWRDRSHRLRQAATVLWEHIDRSTRLSTKSNRMFAMGHIAMMLEGLAVEVMAKAIILQRHPVTPDAESLPWKTGRRGHVLSVLLTEAQVPLRDGRERDLANRLTAYIKWAGRYPVAMKLDHMMPQLSEKAMSLAYGTSYGTQDHDTTGEILARANHIFRRLRRRPR